MAQTGVTAIKVTRNSFANGKLVEAGKSYKIGESTNPANGTVSSKDAADLLNSSKAVAETETTAKETGKK